RIGARLHASRPRLQPMTTSARLARPSALTPPPATHAWAPRRGLVAALALSVAVHVVLSFWPADSETLPETLPLQASIVEMPPPPLPAAAAPVKPRPRPKRPTATRPPVPAPPPAT